MQLILSLCLVAAFQLSVSQEVPACRGTWTPWFNRDGPGGSGDWEQASALIKENPKDMCTKPSAIDAQLTDGRPYTDGGDTLAYFSAQHGLVCVNKEQKDGRCNDYKVRFCCEPQVPTCKGKWTQWFDRDNPGGIGDWEQTSALITQYPKEMCTKPSAIDAQLTDGRPYTDGGDTLAYFSAEHGLVCVNKEQTDGICNDYRVRFCCEPEPACKLWTPWFNRDGPGGSGDWEHTPVLRIQYPGKLCDVPSAIQAQLTDGRPYTDGGDTLEHVNAAQGLVCLNEKQDDRRCNDYKVRFCCETQV